jgi:2-keto-4-pentenoate hydratase/2-oxohepta-3-ene-1,7-dioic acid hydratase in catechol pathway
MRFATVEHQGKTFVGTVDKAGEKVTPLTVDGVSVADINALFRGERCEPKGQPIALKSVKLKAPVPLPLRNIMCVGKNYHEHAKEFSASGFDSSSTGAADAIPTAPIMFTKVPQSVIGPDEPIRYPAGVSEQLDYEAEFAVIIGKGGRGIAKKDALKHVWGCTIVNDVTARATCRRATSSGFSANRWTPLRRWGRGV